MPATIVDRNGRRIVDRHGRRIVPDGPLRFRDALSAQRQTLAGRIRPPAHRISCRLTMSYAGLASRYREVEPYEAKRYLVEIPDRFAVAHWSRDADVSTIARCMLGTLEYEPHGADTAVLRRAIEGVIEAMQTEDKAA